MAAPTPDRYNAIAVNGDTCVVYGDVRYRRDLCIGAADGTASQLCMHGWPRNHREFVPAIDALGDRYTFIAPAICADHACLAASATACSCPCVAPSRA